MLNDQAPRVRRRFTFAHEICHTFFYEIVPEINFKPHPTDSFEEALCNHGAAVLLMPEEDVRAQIRVKDVSLNTLEELSKRYEVSMETMFMRIRGLRLWNCEMTVSHRMVSGAFAVDRVHGWLKADWGWVDDTIPNQAWSQEGGCSLSWRALVYLERVDGLSAAEPVYFELKRRGENLVAIWGKKQLRAKKRRKGLFDRNGKKSE